MKRILEKNNPPYSDLLSLRKIIIDSRAVDFAKMEISGFTNKAKTFCNSSNIRKTYKRALADYCDGLLKV
jgi:hypothetical protein